MATYTQIAKIVSGSTTYQVGQIFAAASNTTSGTTITGTLQPNTMHTMNVPSDITYVTLTCQTSTIGGDGDYGMKTYSANIQNNASDDVTLKITFPTISGGTSTVTKTMHPDLTYQVSVINGVVKMLMV